MRLLAAHLRPAFIERSTRMRSLQFTGRALDPGVLPGVILVGRTFRFLGHRQRGLFEPLAFLPQIGTLLPQQLHKVLNPHPGMAGFYLEQRLVQISLQSLAAPSFVLFE